MLCSDTQPKKAGGEKRIPLYPAACEGIFLGVNVRDKSDQNGMKSFMMPRLFKPGPITLRYSVVHIDVHLLGAGTWLACLRTFLNSYHSYGIALQACQLQENSAAGREKYGT